MKLTDCLNEKSKKAWPEIYERLTGKKWERLTKNGRGIECDVVIKDVDKFMKEKPNSGR
jgi:hypothetical protein